MTVFMHYVNPRHVAASLLEDSIIMRICEEILMRCKCNFLSGSAGQVPVTPIGGNECIVLYAIDKLSQLAPFSPGVLKMFHAGDGCGTKIQVGATHAFTVHDTLFIVLMKQWQQG